MEYRDASGLSARSGTAGTASITGTNAYNTEELDGLGNNVGRLGDLSRPPHDGGPTRSPEDSPTIDDMTMGDCTLDGIPVPCSMAFRSLRSGSALPAHLAKQYQHNPAFAFTPTGSGAFTVTLPKQVGWHVNPDGSIDRIYSQYSGTSHISTYTSGVNITNIPVPPEMTDCEKFLSELLTGEDDAIFSDVTDDDPIDTLTGMNEAPENSVATDDQRLQTHNHLYNPVSNPTRGTRILAPVGGQIIGSGRTNNGNQAFVNVFYKELGGEKNIVLQFFHTFHGEKFEGETMQADGTMSVGKMGSDGSWPIGYGKGENGRPVVGFHVHINAWYWWGKTDRNGDPILKRAGLHPEGKNRTLKTMFKLSNLCPE